MLIKTNNNGFNHSSSSEITSQSVYEGRRDLMKLMAGGVAGAAMATWASRDAFAATTRPNKLAALANTPSKVAGAMALDELGLGGPDQERGDVIRHLVDRRLGAVGIFDLAFAGQRGRHHGDVWRRG